MKKYNYLHKLLGLFLVILGFNSPVYSQQVLVEVLDGSSFSGWDDAWQTFDTGPINEGVGLYSVSVKLLNPDHDMGASGFVYINLYENIDNTGNPCSPVLTNLMASSDTVAIDNTKTDLFEFHFPTAVPINPNSRYYFRVKDDDYNGGSFQVINFGGTGLSGGTGGNCSTLNHIVKVIDTYNLYINVVGLADTNSVSFSNTTNMVVDTLDANTNNNLYAISSLNNLSAYDVSLTNQPTTPNQECSFLNAPSGSINGNDVQINVECITNQYSIAVDVSGLVKGNSVNLLNNGKDFLQIDLNGITLFNLLQDDETEYDITVQAQPSDPDQQCDIINGNGFISGSNLTIDVVCNVVNYPLAINVSGLAQSNFVDVLNNGMDFLRITSNGLSFFNQSFPDFSDYAIAFLLQPSSPNQTCTFDISNMGMINGPENIVLLTCVTNSYFIGGFVSGLHQNNGLIVTINETEDEIITNNGAYVFNTPLLDESTYSVTVEPLPMNSIQPCTVSNKNASLTGMDITNVDITCEFGEDLIFFNGFDSIIGFRETALKIE